MLALKNFQHGSCAGLYYLFCFAKQVRFYVLRQITVELYCVLNGGDMKIKRILTLTACVLLILCLVCTGCTPEEPTIPDEGGSGGGGGGEVTPVFEANNFSDDVYALANRRGDEGVFEDYYRENVPFDQLVDRQIGVIATEIVERLNDVYGSDNYKYSFDSEVPDYTTWQVGEARGAKYAVHLLGDVFFVFVLDEQGNYIEDEQGFPLESDGKTYEAVYFASEQDNNMEEYIGNPSCQALACYLLNGEYSDTYLDNQSGLEVNEQKLSVLAGSIYGDNVYVQQENEIVLQQGQWDMAWRWASYFADDTAVDRLKYNIAKIIADNESINQVTDCYDSNYDSLLSEIPYLSNYLDCFYEEIRYFVANFVIGTDTIETDNASISTLQNVLAKSKDYRETFEYAVNDLSFEVCLRSLTDINEYNAKYFYYDCDIWSNVRIIPQTGKTFEEEYEYLVFMLQRQANFYDGIDQRQKPYFDLYYGIDESGYIDEAGTVKSFNQIEFPYSWEDMIACRNVKNYEAVLDGVLDAVKNQTFAENTHAGQYSDSLAGESVYFTYYRVSQDYDITKMSTMSTGDNANITFNNNGNYNQFIIPATGNVGDLSHYDLQISVGNCQEDISLEIKVQTVDDNYNTVVAVLDSSDLQGSATTANGKFVVDKNATWQGTFHLPQTTAIVYSEQYAYSDGTVSENNQIVTYADGQILFRQGDVKDCLIVYVTAYDKFGREINLDATYGISIKLTNTFQIN